MSIFTWLNTPFRSMISLDRRQIRSLFSVMMLLGIMSLSVENWALVALAYDAVSKGDNFSKWFDLLSSRVEWNSILQGWFAFIMGLITFGAEWLRVKIGDKELEAGKGQKTEPAQ